MAAKCLRQKPSINLHAISEERILEQRICDLSLQIKGTWLEQRVDQLYRELKANGLIFKPECYLSDEWQTPEDQPTIGIPFYLAHPRLISLEEKLMLEAEGNTNEWCMKLLRHEAGHALSFAFRLQRKRSWQKVFGSTSQAYEETYRYRPYSKSFVRHLDYYYAQYHPDEDFAETFAVWLTPGMDWRKKYHGWKALDKLIFVERLMNSIKGKPALVTKGIQRWKAAHIKSTLKRYYKRRHYMEAEDYPQFHDPNLKRMFIEGKSSHDTRRSVTKLIKAYRRPLLAVVSGWTKERKFMANEILKAIYQRSKALHLVTEDTEPVVVLQLATYVTTLMMNYRYTNTFRGED